MKHLAFALALLFTTEAFGDTRAHEARYIDVKDGDTATLEIALGFGLWMRVAIRLCGVDAPEIGTGKPGLDAKHWLHNRLRSARWISAYMNLKVRCEPNNCELMSFTRYVAEVYADGVSVNDEIIVKGFAKPHKKKCR